jgi:hypothetical protein
VNRRTLLPLLLLVAALLTGCDDALLFDVTKDGRLLAAVDGRGRVADRGDGNAPRHLVLLDPRGGDVERLTDAPLPISWPRACGDGAVFVEARTRLVLLRDGVRRVLLESERRLLQPTPSPSGEQVAVLEADKPGLPGTLHVIALSGSAALAPVDGVLLGFSWSGDDALLVPCLEAPDDARPFEGGAGEIFLHRAGERRTLFRGELPGLTWLASGPGGVAAVLPLGEPNVLGLARLSLDAPGATRGEQAGACDLWATADAHGRVLFTRALPERPTLEGELRLGSLESPAVSRRVSTPGRVSAPRFLGDDKVAYLTPDDRLVTQGLDGQGLVDWTGWLAAAVGEIP